MKEYWLRPDAHAAAPIADGWFRSGDIGFLDEQGYLTISDRVKDMIISGGENIYPAEVEQLIMERTEIESVAVIGVPDERWGEVPLAIAVRPLRDRPRTTCSRILPAASPSTRSPWSACSSTNCRAQRAARCERPICEGSSPWSDRPRELSRGALSADRRRLCGERGELRLRLRGEFGAAAGGRARRSRGAGHCASMNSGGSRGSARSSSSQSATSIVRMTIAGDESSTVTSRQVVDERSVRITDAIDVPRVADARRRSGIRPAPERGTP